MATVAQLAVGIRNEAGPGSRAFGRDVGRMGRDASVATTQVGRLQTKLATTGATAKSAGSQMLAMFGVFGGLIVVAQATRAISEFEETMALAGKVSRASGDQFDRMAKQAKMLGSTTRFTAAEAADGLLFLARAGFEAEQAIAALPATLDLAAAGVMGLGEAADLASNVVKQFGLEAEQTVRVVDALIIVSNRANTNVSQLGEALKYAGPVAGALGLTVEQTTSALGALGDAGIQASLAGTNLRGIMAGLLGPTSKAKAALGKMGLSLEDIDVEANGVVGVFERFKAANLSASDAVAIFGRRNASAALVLTDSVKKMAALEAATILARGEAEEMSKVMAGTLKGSLAALKSAFEGVMIASGDQGLAGALQATVDVMTGVLRVFGGVGHTVDRFKALVVTLSLAIEVLVIRFIAIKALSLVVFFGGLVRSIYAAGVAARATAGVFATLKASMMALGGPVGVISLIATALAVGIGVFHSYSRATAEQEGAMRSLVDATDAYSESLDRVNRQTGFEGRVSSQIAAARSLVDMLKQARTQSEVVLGSPESQRAIYDRNVRANQNRGLRGGTMQNIGPFREQRTDEFNSAVRDARAQLDAMQRDISSRKAEIDQADMSATRRSLANLKLFADVKQIVDTLGKSADFAGSKFTAFRTALDEMGVLKTKDQMDALALSFAEVQSAAGGAVTPIVGAEAAGGKSSGFMDALTAPLEKFREAMAKTMETVQGQLRRQQEQQALITLEMQGQTREAVQQAALFQAEGVARNNLVRLTQAQRDAVVEGAGQLYDMQEALRAQETAAAKALELEREKTRELERQADLRKGFQDSYADEVERLAENLARLRVETDQGTEAGARFAEQQEMAKIFMQAMNGATDEQRAKLLELRDEYQMMSEQQKIMEAQQKITQAAQQLSDAAGQAFSGMVLDIVDGSKSAQQALKDFGKTIANMVMQQIMAMTVTRIFSAGMMGAFGGLGGAAAFGAGGMGPPAYAKGAAFNRGVVVPYSYGGVVGSPSYFPMSGGRTGLMGESGPEAIMPLRRGSDGKLGVQSAGNTQKNVTINMNVSTPDADSFRRSKTQIARSLKAAQADI